MHTDKEMEIYTRRLRISLFNALQFFPYLPFSFLLLYLLPSSFSFPFRFFLPFPFLSFLPSFLPSSVPYYFLVHDMFQISPNCICYFYHLTLLYRIVLFFILVFKVQDVMDGDLDDFISAYLRTSVDGRKSKVDQNLDADD